MAFMIIAVFIFFIMVGLFLLQISIGGMKKTAQEREKEQVISSLEIFSEMPELSCSEKSSFCIDEDKIFVLKNLSEIYSEFWPVSFVRVYKITDSSSLIECPRLNCNYYIVYEDKNQDEKIGYSSYVAICKKIRRESSVYDDCYLGKIELGVKKIKD